MSKFSNNNINAAGPLVIPAVKGILDAIALGAAATGLPQTENQDYQTEFLRNHGMMDPREEAIRDILKNTSYIPRRHTSYISQPISIPEIEWYAPNPGTIYGGIIPEVEIISVPKAESRVGDAIGVLTGKKSISRDSIQDNRDTIRRNNSQNNQQNDQDKKYFDWSKDMSWQTPTESALKYLFKPRAESMPLWRIGLNWSPFIGGGYYLGKSLGWWGNNNSSDEHSSNKLNDDGWGK